MKTIKSFYFAAAAAMALAVSCSKSSPEVENNYFYTAPAETGLYEVKFGTRPQQVQSKSIGAIGGVAGADNTWSGKETLFIYGFNRNIGVANPSDPSDYVRDFTGATVENGYCLINNVAAQAPAGSDKGSITVYKDKDTQEPFFYTPEDCFDFYGYYIDDAANELAEDGITPVAVVEADRVYVPFTINGGQDLMVAKADQSADIAGSEVSNEAYAYSAYSARRDVHPNLVFTHELARFVFKIKAGNNSENATGVTINSLTVRSMTSGNLVVAGLGGTECGIADADAGSYAELELKEKDAEGNLVALGTAAPVKPALGDEAVKIGESLLLMPGETVYDLTLNISQENYTGVIVPQTHKVRISVPEGNEAKVFEAGHQYNVILTVYGLEEVRVSVELTPWVDSDEPIIIDPDKKD